MDFIPISSSKFDVFETLSEGNRRACFDVTIILDEVSEVSETFSLQLSFDDFVDEGVRNIVIIKPSVVYVTIQDTAVAGKISCIAVTHHYTFLTFTYLLQK